MENDKELMEAFALTEDDLDKVAGGKEVDEEIYKDIKVDAGHKVYVVQAGDSLHSIAEAHGTTTAQLALLNRNVIIKTAQDNGYYFDNPVLYAHYLFEGEELLLP